MSATAEQTKAEIQRSLYCNNESAYSTKKPHNESDIISSSNNTTKKSVSWTSALSEMKFNTVGECKDSDPSKFALRSLSVKEQIRQKTITPFSDITDPSKSKNAQDLTVNKLRFHSVGLLGRDEEIMTLNVCLNKMIQPGKQTKEVVMISGYSGTGKSALVYNLKKNNKKGGVFITGKFDQYNSGEPLVAILQAFGELCCMVAKKGTSFCKEIEKKLHEELKNEVYLLTQIIPDINKVIQHTSGHTYIPNDTSSDARQTRLNYAFRIFVRVMSSHFSPLVICLDDLQWADISSLEMIEILASDVQNKHTLMIIGCYRSNEVDAAHILSRSLDALSEMKKKDDELMHLTQIELGNLSREETDQVIMALLSIDDASQTRGLASICYKRTLGNPFFLLEFIKLLEEEGLLYFHLGCFGWKWDDTNIQSRTSSTENVVNLLQSKMEKLPIEAQRFLQCAACLGASFNAKTIDLVWQRQRVTYLDPSVAETSTEALLTMMVEGNYWEKHKKNGYRWTHDNVQQAASFLIEEESRASFRRNIGKILYNELDEEKLEASLFEVASLLNAEMIAEPTIDDIKINLMAAKKARDISAFEHCSRYASRGISMLPKNKWVFHSEITLKLYSLAAGAEGFLGRHSQMDNYCNEVLVQKSLSTLQKIDVYLAKLDRMANAELQYEDAINLCLAILKDLGCRFPHGRVIGLLKGLVSVRNTVNTAKKTPTEVFESLVVELGPSKLAVMALLNRLSAWSYLAGEKFSYLFFLATTKMVKMTLSHGLFDVSAFSLISVGLLSLSVMGDVDTAQYIAKRATHMQEKCPSEAGKAGTITALYCYLFHHTKPLQYFPEPLLKGYQSGMRSGDKVFAMWCLFLSHAVKYVIGKPLSMVQEECKLSISQMVELKEEEQASCLRLYWQLCLNLMGSSNNTVKISGNAMDEEEVVFGPGSHANFIIVKTVASNMFGRYELGAHQVIGSTDKQYFKISGGILQCFMFWFHRCLCLYGMARENNNKKKQYMAQANQIYKALTKSLKKKNPNILHYVSLMNAEKAALKQKKSKKDVIKLYNGAIRISARSGYVHDAALAQERFADFLLSVGDVNEARYHIEGAIKRYTVWGALGIVKHLRDKYKH